MNLLSGCLSQGLELEAGAGDLQRLRYRAGGWQFWDWKDSVTGSHRIHYISAGLIATGLTTAPPAKLTPTHCHCRPGACMCTSLTHPDTVRCGPALAGPESSGEKPTILLVHGFGASAYHWRYNIPALVEAGYRVFAVDLLGFGWSDKAITSYDDYSIWQRQLSDFVRDIVRLG